MSVAVRGRSGDPMVSEHEILSDAKIKTPKPGERAYRLGDSGQLYLQVTPSGGRHWRAQAMGQDGRRPEVTSCPARR